MIEGTPCPEESLASAASRRPSATHSPKPPEYFFIESFCPGRLMDLTVGNSVGVFGDQARFCRAGLTPRRKQQLIAAANCIRKVICGASWH
jgi:hypothetical protein